MFATENDYTEAVRGSQIHTYENEAQKKTTIINLIILTTLIVVGYFAFNYYTKHDVSVSSSAVIAKKAVLGVSHIATTSSNVEEDAYLIALENMEVDTLESNEPANNQVNNNPIDISEAMSSIVAGSTETNSDYAQNISKEIQKNTDSKKRVIVVQKGDTLASLSAKYYGSEMNYKKIVASNSKISSDSGLIYAGEEIVLPY